MTKFFNFLLLSFEILFLNPNLSPIKRNFSYYKFMVIRYEIGTFRRIFPKKAWFQSSVSRNIRLEELQNAAARDPTSPGWVSSF